MAGIAGILDTSMLSHKESLLSLARAMSGQAPGAKTLRTDAAADESTGIVLAATGIPDANDSARLTAIARSTSGRFLIAMTGGNGPFHRLRKTIGREFDPAPTAAIIATAIELIGSARTIALAEGPLALAVWDRDERTLTIGRDRYGQETIFAAWAGSSFIFGSHLFSLVTHPRFRREIDRGALAQYLRFGHSLSPSTIFANTVRITPGSSITIHAVGPRTDLEQIPVAAVREDAQYGIAHPFSGDAAGATDALEAALRTSLREATRDPATPMAFFFSGGLDSTLLAAVAAGMRERPVHAITAGFSETAHDESSHACTIAKHLGIEHHLVQFTENDMRDLLPIAAQTYQEPFGDLAALPSIHLARAIREFAPIVVTGDGGDELFEGNANDPLLRIRGLLHGPLRPLAAHSLDLLAAGSDRAKPAIDRYVPGKVARYLRPTRIRKAAAGIYSKSPEEVRGVLNADTLDPRAFIVNSRPEPRNHYTDSGQWLHTNNLAERARYARIYGYTLDREVPKHQRAITAEGMAYRGALFHPAVAELAWSLPSMLRDHKGESRSLIRGVIAKSVPRELFERKKAGFDVPFHLWLRGSLRDIGEELLSERRLRVDGIFEPAPVRREWDQHLSGKYDRRYILYNLISFQLWVESMERVSVAS